MSKLEKKWEEYYAIDKDGKELYITNADGGQKYAAREDGSQIYAKLANKDEYYAIDNLGRSFFAQTADRQVYAVDLKGNQIYPTVEENQVMATLDGVPYYAKWEKQEYYPKNRYGNEYSGTRLISTDVYPATHDGLVIIPKVNGMPLLAADGDGDKIEGVVYREIGNAIDFYTSIPSLSRPSDNQAKKYKFKLKSGWTSYCLKVVFFLVLLFALFIGLVTTLRR